MLRNTIVEIVNRVIFQKSRKLNFESVSTDNF